MPPHFVGPPTRRILRIGMPFSFFPPNFDTFRPPRRRDREAALGTGPGNQALAVGGDESTAPCDPRPSPGPVGRAVGPRRSPATVDPLGLRGHGSLARPFRSTG